MDAHLADRLQRLAKLFSPAAHDSSQLAPLGTFEASERRSDTTSGLLCELMRHGRSNVAAERVRRTRSTLWHALASQWARASWYVFTLFRHRTLLNSTSTHLVRHIYA